MDGYNEGNMLQCRIWLYTSFYSIFSTQAQRKDDGKPRSITAIISIQMHATSFQLFLVLFRFIKDKKIL